jgi:glycosyltransferase involved in cell wall biosynthesis
MRRAAARERQRPAGSRDPLVEVTVPVYNEAKVLAHSIRQLHSYLTGHFPFPFVITIADNASTDGTFAIAQQMGIELPGVRAVHLDRKGRGLALRHAWAAPTPISSPTWTPTCPPAWTRSSR